MSPELHLHARDPEPGVRCYYYDLPPAYEVTPPEVILTHLRTRLLRQYPFASYVTGDKTILRSGWVRFWCHLRVASDPYDLDWARHAPHRPVLASEPDETTAEALQHVIDSEL